LQIRQFLFKGCFLVIAVATGECCTDQTITVSPNALQKETGGSGNCGLLQKITAFHECLQYEIAATVPISMNFVVVEPLGREATPKCVSSMPRRTSSMGKSDGFRKPRMSAWGHSRHFGGECPLSE
jgi:hypothetical protein